MQHMADIYKEVVELKKRQMEIRFTPISARDKSYISELRMIKGQLAKLNTQLHEMRTSVATVEENQ